MSQGDNEAGLSAAARLLAREARIAAIVSGRDLFIAGATGECLACLHGPLLADAARVGLVLVPDGNHALCVASRATSLPVKAMVVTPDSSDEERRALGVALQNRTVQLILVTPERLRQERFVQFVRGLSLAYVAVASSQRLLPGREDHCVPYVACRGLRGLFPNVPMVSLADHDLDTRTQNELAAALGMLLPPVELPVALEPAPVPALEVQEGPSAPEISPPPSIAPHRAPAQRWTIPAPHRAAFSLFESEMSIAAVARQLERDESWAWQALESFIRATGRPHPFPWVSKPDYMTVSMAAGQAESTNPRMIASVLRGKVEEGPMLMVLAALENR